MGIQESGLNIEKLRADVRERVDQALRFTQPDYRGERCDFFDLPSSLIRGWKDRPDTGFTFDNGQFFDPVRLSLRSIGNKVTVFIPLIPIEAPHLAFCYLFDLQQRSLTLDTWPSAYVYSKFRGIISSNTEERVIFEREWIILFGFLKEMKEADYRIQTSLHPASALSGLKEKIRRAIFPS